MKSLFSTLWERHLAAMIVAGSHSHRKNNLVAPQNGAARHKLLIAYFEIG